MSNFSESPLSTRSPSASRSSRVKRHHSKSPILSRCLRRTSSTSLSLVSISPPIASLALDDGTQQQGSASASAPAPAQAPAASEVSSSSRVAQQEDAREEKSTGNANANVKTCHNVKSCAAAGATSTGGKENVSRDASAPLNRPFDTTTNEPPPSPSSLRVKVTAVRRMCNLWSQIKNSSPVRRAKMSTWVSSGASGSINAGETSSGRRSSHHSLFSLKGMRGKKDKLKTCGQYSYSHPDISSGNLASLAFPSSSSRDDMAINLVAKYAGDSRHEPVPPVTHSSSIKGDSNGPCDDQPALAKSLKKQLISAFSRQSSADLDVSTRSTAATGDGAPSDAADRVHRDDESPLPTNYPFFQLEVHLHYGRDLLAKDAGGTSDPYVKFKIGGKQLYRSKTISKTLNPVWNEHFMTLIDHLSSPLVLRVFDYDFGFQDDFLGTASIDLTTVQWNLAQEYKLMLSETGKETEEQWGYVVLGVRLQPKTQEEKDELFGKNAKTNVVLASSVDHHTILGGALTHDSPHHSSAGSHPSKLKKQKTQTWDSVVNIILIEGRGLSAKDENGLSDPYVRFKLGNEKYKSKVIFKTLNPVWNEQFDLHAFADQSKTLEMCVYDKDHHGRDDFMGKCTVQLDNLVKEETHSLVCDLEGGEGTLHLVITVSGTLGSAGESSNLLSYSHSTESLCSQNRYSLLSTLRDVEDVGSLVVKVYKAENLAAADFTGKSDPFVVVQLVNARLQTNTEYKTLSPEWNKIFTLKVKDVHETLDVTVYDEDRDKKVEFLGRVLIPLLRIRNGEKMWYQLKDKKCTARSKGQILLELTLMYNPLRAAIRTINPREDKFITPDVKFKRTTFVRNVIRVKSLVMEILDIIKFINSCFTWQSVPRSLCALFLFLTLTYYFETYMIPLALLLVFAKYHATSALSSYFASSSSLQRDDEQGDDIFDSTDDPAIASLEGDVDDPGEKKTLKERLQSVQEITALVQNVLGEIASFGERVKNTFNFSVPFLSYFAIIVLITVCIILYFIPLRYLLMIWGLNKFTKKLRNPNAINNNELLDFISRAPDSDEKLMFKELRPLSASLASTSDSMGRKKQK